MRWCLNCCYVHVLQAYCFSLCADSPARADMQNMMRYNGFYGCGWCLHPGQSDGKVVKYTPKIVADDRDPEETKQLMAIAAATEETIQGVKGPTPLMNLPFFNVVWGLTPDYMHCVLLGVSQQLTDLWIGSADRSYYIGSQDQTAEINKRLCGIKPHLILSYLPRSILLRRFWKAAEWQQWLLYFSLPCLEGILPSVYFKHWALLVEGIALLLQSSVSSSDVEKSTTCLVKFVVGMEELYDEKQMMFNVHQLLHIPKSVLLQGPLWAHSCFSFESNMGNLKRLVTSAKRVPLQIVERLMMARNYHGLRAQANPRTQQFLSKTSNAKASNNQSNLLLSKPRALSGQLLAFVESELGDTVCSPVKEHDRVTMSRHVFHSEQYSRPYKTDSTAVLTGQGEYLKIKNIISFKDAQGTVRVFVVSDQFCTASAYSCSHIVKLRRVGARRLFELTSSDTPCIYIKHDEAVFFVRLAMRTLSVG